MSKGDLHASAAARSEGGHGTRQYTFNDSEILIGSAGVSRSLVLQLGEGRSGREGSEEESGGKTEHAGAKLALIQLGMLLAKSKCRAYDRYMTHFF